MSSIGQLNLPDKDLDEFFAAVDALVIPADEGLAIVADIGSPPSEVPGVSVADLAALDATLATFDLYMEDQLQADKPPAVLSTPSSRPAVKAYLARDAAAHAASTAKGEANYVEVALKNYKTDLHRAGAGKERHNENQRGIYATNKGTPVRAYAVPNGPDKRAKRNLQKAASKAKKIAAMTPDEHAAYLIDNAAKAVARRKRSREAAQAALPAVKLF